MLVDIVVFDALDEMDAWGPAEVVRSAGKRGADMQVRLVTRLRRRWSKALRLSKPLAKVAVNLSSQPRPSQMMSAA